MLWKRQSKPSIALVEETDATRTSGPRSLTPSVPPDVELENALDALGGVFRALGRHAFELPELDAKTTSELCERWATHLLVRSPVPDGPWNQGDALPRAARREYGAALHYATNLRRTEHSHITKSMQDLRQAIWAFVHNLNQALTADGAANTRVTAQLSRLHEAARGPSTDDLKREAITAAHAIGQILEERKREQLAHVEVLGERMAQLGRALEEARREVGLDPLTRLFNRKTFDEQLARVNDMSSLFGQSACLLVIDIDHFKHINDGFGHPAGDEVLRLVADTMVRVFRRRDDVVARFGGDEFAVILRETELKESLMLGQRLVESIRSMPIDQGGQAVRVSVSVGACQAKAGETSDAWLARADRALYRAKESGRDRVSD
jgi:diguanylate cyclase